MYDIKKSLLRQIASGAHLRQLAGLALNEDACGSPVKLGLWAGGPGAPSAAGHPAGACDGKPAIVVMGGAMYCTRFCMCRRVRLNIMTSSFMMKTIDRSTKLLHSRQDQSAQHTNETRQRRRQNTGEGAGGGQRVGSAGGGGSPGRPCRALGAVAEALWETSTDERARALRGCHHS